MHGVAHLLAAASVAYVLARLLRVPAIPLLLLSGLVLSWIAPPPTELLGDALVLGVAFLLFVVGIELDPRRVRAQRRAALRVGAIQFLVLAVVGFVAAVVLGYAGLEALYLALALTASSTLVCVRLLQRREQMFEPFGRLVLGVLLLQDILILLAIPLVGELADGWLAVLEGLLGLALLAGMSLGMRRLAGPLFLRIADDEEALLLASLAVLFLFMAASDVLGLPVITGAFLAGASLSRFPVNGLVRAELAPVGDFFSVIFFTALGALVRIPTALEMAHAAVLVVLLVLVTPPLVAVVAERAGLAAKSAIEAGLLLSQTSEISLVIGLTGMLAGDIGESVFVVIAVATLTTMLLTPFLATDEMAWRLMHLHPSRRGPHREPPEGHVLLLGAGSTGMPLLEDLLVAGCSVVVVDDDPSVVTQLEEAGIPTIRGDAADQAVLRRAGAHRARAVSSTIRRPRDNGPLLEMAGGTTVLVRVFDRKDARWVQERGGVPILYSEATADGLVEWFLDEREELERRLEERGGTGVAAS